MVVFGVSNAKYLTFDTPNKNALIRYSRRFICYIIEYVQLNKTKKGSLKKKKEPKK